MGRKNIMKTMRKLFLAVSLLFVGNIIIAQSYYQVTVDVLNVRSSASKDSQIVGKFNLGDSVYVIDYEPNWSKVKLNETDSGYVATKYLSSEFKTYATNQNTETTKSKSSGWSSLLILVVIVLIWFFKGSSKSSSGTTANRSIPKPKVLNWYFCKNCNEKIQSGKRPTSQNCSRATFHNWTDLGEVGDRNFNCKNCGTTVWTKKRPTSQNCSRDTFHNWTEL